MLVTKTLYFKISDFLNSKKVTLLIIQQPDKTYGLVWLLEGISELLFRNNFNSLCRAAW